MKMHFVDRLMYFWLFVVVGGTLLFQKEGYFVKMMNDPLNTWLPLLGYFVLLPWLVLRGFVFIVYRR